VPAEIRRINQKNLIPQSKISENKKAHDMMVDPATQDPRSERKCVAHQHQNTIYHAKKKIVRAILIIKKPNFFCCLTTEHEHVPREEKTKETPSIAR
jgi:hypothetical protein